jgi:hypothetical protein
MEGETKEKATKTPLYPEGGKVFHGVPNVKKEIEDEIEDYIETLNKSDEPPTQEAKNQSVTDEKVGNENEDDKKHRAPEYTPISSLGDLKADLTNVKTPVTIKFTKVEPSSSKEDEEEGIKGRIRKPDDNEDDPDTKGPRKTKTKYYFPPETEAVELPKETVQTRKQRAETRKLANEKIPKKNSIEHRNKIDIEIIELSDDESQRRAPEHHDAQKAATKNVTQKTPQVLRSSKPKKNTTNTTNKGPANPPQGSKGPADTEVSHKVELPVVRAVDKKIVSLGPRTEDN